MVENNAVFYGESENEQKKDKKFFDLPERGLEAQIFSNFPAHNLNFQGRSNQNNLHKEIEL